MTLTKLEIINNIQEKLVYPRKEAIEVVEKLLETIKESLVSGEDVMISGFGKFCVKEKAQRKGRNPATGEDMMLSARRVVTFISSGNLREKVNGNVAE